MSGFKVKLITNNGTFEYDKKQIKDLRTRTFSTNDPSKPVFKAFPNIGTIVILDTNLNLFNMAINGEFDNTYNFSVQIFKGDNLIAYHLVNQRPQYDFRNKTLTLSLGNEIDSFASTNYNGFSYQYNKENIPFTDIIEDILKTNDYDKESTVMLNSDIKYGYLPEDNKQSAIDKVLQATLCSLIKVPNQNSGLDKFKIISMVTSGGTKPIYKILPKHINKSFSTDIILDNKFTTIFVNTIKLYRENINSTFYSNLSTLFNTYKPENDEYKTTRYFLDKIESLVSYVGFIGAKYIQSYYFNLNDTIPKYYNLNTVKFFYLPKPEKLDNNENYENVNPKISISYKVKKYINKPISVEISQGENPQVINWNYNDYDNSYFEEEVEEEYIVNNELLSSTISINRSGGYGIIYEGTLNLEFDRFKKLNYNELENQINFNAEIFGGCKYIELDLSTSIDRTTEDSIIVNGNGKLIEIIPINITYSFEGDLNVIKFDNNYLNIYANEDYQTNVFENKTTNELIQDGLDYSISDNPSYEAIRRLGTFYKDGIRTANLSVVFGDYQSTDTTNSKNVDTPFEIGDLVIPCKDFNGTPIITKENSPVVYKVVSNEIEFNSNAGIQHLQLVESPFVNYETNLNSVSLTSIENEGSEYVEESENVENLEITDTDLLNL